MNHHRASAALAQIGVLELLYPWNKFANFYFFCVGLMQMWKAVSLTNGQPSSFMTLTFIVICEMFFKGKEDLERLVEPFERLGSHLLKTIEKPEARIACDQHMETWWLMQRVLQDRRTAPAARLREPPADGELRVPPTPSCASCSSCLEERAGSWLGGGCSVPGAAPRAAELLLGPPTWTAAHARRAADARAVSRGRRGSRA